MELKKPQVYYIVFDFNSRFCEVWVCFIELFAIILYSNLILIIDVEKSRKDDLLTNIIQMEYFWKLSSMILRN